MEEEDPYQNRERLVQKEGEWLERYVEKLFQIGGFETQRNVHIRITPDQQVEDVLHEIDVLATAHNQTILIECKDRLEISKALVDAFVGKLHDIGAVGGAFVTTKIDQGDLRRFRTYAARHRILFLDGKDLEELWGYFLQNPNVGAFNAYLLRLFGLRQPQVQGQEQKPRSLWNMLLGRG